MTLPPRANLVAVRHADPAVVDAVERAMRAHPELRDDVWRPQPGWIAASAPLPESGPEPAGVRAAGLTFADGRDVVLAAAAPERVAALAPERLAELPGDFTFVRFEGDGATAVRACGAGVPIHAGVDGERIAITTRLDLLVAVLDERWRFDPLVAGTWMSGWALHPYRRSLLAGFLTPPRGYAAVLRPRSSPSLVRYWDPQPQSGETLRPSDEHPAELRESLLSALERELDPEGRNLLTLSGGVDSSSLAALAGRTLGRSFSTLSVMSGDAAAAASERPYLDNVYATCNVRRHRERASTAAERFELLRHAPPCITPITHAALCLLPDVIAEEPVRVMFGGENADEICGAELGFGDWIDHTSVPSLLRNVRSLPGGPRAALRWARWRLEALAGDPRLPSPDTLPDFVRPEIRSEYAEWRQDRKAEFLADQRPRRWLARLGEHDGPIAMNWEAASSLGIRRTYPFMTRELMERAFRWHPSELLGGRGPGRSKVILRRALAHDVPALNLSRPDRGHHPLPGARDPNVFTGVTPEALAPVVVDELLESPRTPRSWLEVRALTMFEQPSALLRGLYSA
jgi:hypothetical protein